MKERNNNLSAYEHFIDVCKRASLVQKELLENLIDINKTAEYVQKNKIFLGATKESVAGFSENAPLSKFSDYKPYIERMMQGESNVLFSEDVAFYNISSGSTGDIKHLPLTKEDIYIQHQYIDLAVNEIICRNIPHESEEDIFGTIFTLNEFFKTNIDGVPSGVRSGTYYWYTETHGGFDTSQFTALHEVFFPDEIEDMLYAKVRFALANPDVTAIYGVFVHRAVGLFSFIEQNWDALVEDIRNGTVNECFGVSEKWKEFIISKLGPDRKRADELSRIPKEDFSRGMLLKIWNKLKVIRVIDGDAFFLYSDLLKVYAEGIGIHSFAYANSESVIGIDADMNGKNEYVLIPDACYYEFIPEKAAKEDKTLTIGEVRAGERYELVITTRSGLWRYHTGDVIEITGFLHEAPKVKICYRTELIISLYDEMMTTEQITRSFDKMAKAIGVEVYGFCVGGDNEIYPPRYNFFVEKDNNCDFPFGEETEKLLDTFLCECNAGYNMIRTVHDLEQVRIYEVAEGTFDAYENQIWESGHRGEQAKPIRILHKNEQIQFFKDRII